MKVHTFGFLIKEGISNIRHNSLMSTASFSTVMLCLLVLSIFVLAVVNLDTMVSSVESGVEITAFLQDNVSLARIQLLEQEIRSIPGVEKVTFVSKEEALEQLKRQFGEQKGLLEGVEEMNPLPNAFRIRINPALVSSISEQISGMKGVESVRDDRKVVERLVNLTRTARTLGFGLTVLLGVVTLFVVSNTVRLTIYARRNEISIMRLVGATNSFIRWPFLIEGLTLGALGALAAVGLSAWGYGWVTRIIRESLPFLPLAPAQPLLNQLGIVVVVIGMLLGAGGSLISVRRFLQV